MAAMADCNMLDDVVHTVKGVKVMITYGREKFMLPLCFDPQRRFSTEYVYITDSWACYVKDSQQLIASSSKICDPNSTADLQQLADMSMKMAATIYNKLSNAYSTKSALDEELKKLHTTFLLVNFAYWYLVCASEHVFMPDPTKAPERVVSHVVRHARCKKEGRVVRPDRAKKASKLPRVIIPVPPDHEAIVETQVIDTPLIDTPKQPVVEELSAVSVVQDVVPSKKETVETKDDTPPNVPVRRSKPNAKQRAKARHRRTLMDVDPGTDEHAALVGLHDEASLLTASDEPGACPRVGESEGEPDV